MLVQVLAKDMLHPAQDPVMAVRRMPAAVKPVGEVLISEANRRRPIFCVPLTLLTFRRRTQRRT